MQHPLWVLPYPNTLAQLPTEKKASLPIVRFRTLSRAGGAFARRGFERAKDQLVRKRVLSVFGLAMVAVSAPAAPPAVDSPPPARVVVQLRPGIFPSVGGFLGATVPDQVVQACGQALATYPVTSVRPAVDAQNHELAHRLGLDRFYIVELGVANQTSALAAALSIFDELFEAVEIDAPRRVILEATGSDEYAQAFDFPDDTYFDLQWALLNAGQSIRGIPGIPGADIDIVRAWELSTGSPQVVVAVLDSGISLSHPDLQGQLVQGRNFTSADAADLDDTSVSHGTHIAGIIAANANNGLGISGIAPGCRIMPIKIVNRFSWTFEEWLANGLIWATDHGATVASVSLGFSSATSLQRAAVQYAFESDVVVCASSGNIGSDPIGFPARLPETIAVGATNNLDEVESFTSTGPQLTLCAPGRDVFSTWDTTGQPDTYDYRSGTSFACPQVAGVAALVRSVNPSLSNREVRRVLAVTCRDLGEPGPDHASGWGRLDAGAAVELAHSYPGDTVATCIADLNGDGAIGFSDLQIFLSAFTNGLSIADRNHDGIIDVNDMLRYLSEYVAGCP